MFYISHHPLVNIIKYAFYTQDKMQRHPRKGNFRGDLLDISLRTQARAKRLNELENEKMKKFNNTLMRHERVNNNILNRLHKRVDEVQKSRRGFQEVLNSDYKFSKFHTMKRRYFWEEERPISPKTARKIKLETRIYHSGFEKRWFQPEIESKVRKTDINRVHGLVRKVLLEQCVKDSHRVFDRQLSNAAFYKDIDDCLKDKAEIKLFRKPPNKANSL